MSTPSLNETNQSHPGQEVIGWWVTMIAAIPVTLLTSVTIVAFVFAIRWHRQKLQAAKNLPMRRRTWIGDSKRYVSYQAREAFVSDLQRSSSTKYNEIYEPWDAEDEARAYDHMPSGTSVPVEIGYSHVDRQPDNSWNTSYSHIDDSFQFSSGEFEPDDETYERSLITDERGEAVEYTNAVVELHTPNDEAASKDTSYDHSNFVQGQAKGQNLKPARSDPSYDQANLATLKPEGQKGSSRNQDLAYDHSNFGPNSQQKEVPGPITPTSRSYDHAHFGGSEPPPLPRRPSKYQPSSYDQSSLSTCTKHLHAIPKATGYDVCSFETNDHEKGHISPRRLDYDVCNFDSTEIATMHKNVPHSDISMAVGPAYHKIDTVNKCMKPRVSFKRDDSYDVATLRREEEVEQTMQVFDNTLQTDDDEQEETTGVISGQSIVSKFKENRAAIMAKFAIKENDEQQPKEGRHEYFILEKIE